MRKKGRSRVEKRDQERLAVAIRDIYNRNGSNITKTEAVRQGLDVCWPGGAPVKATPSTIHRYFTMAMSLPNPGGITKNGTHKPAAMKAAEVCTITAPGLSITLDLGKLPMLLHAIAYAVADKVGGES